DHHQRSAGAGELFNHVQHFANQFRIQRRSWLIKQHHARAQRQRAGNGDALLLAAGEVTRPGIGFIAQTYHIQKAVGVFNSLFFTELFMRDGCFNQVFQHRKMRKKIEVLKHVPNVDALFEDLFLFELVEFVTLTAIADVIPVNLDKAFVYALQMVNSAQQRRFSRSRGSEDHRHGARWDLKRDVIERFMSAKKLTDAGYGNVSFRRGLHEQAPVLAKW